MGILVSKARGTLQVYSLMTLGFRTKCNALKYLPTASHQAKHVQTVLGRRYHPNFLISIALAWTIPVLCMEVQGCLLAVDLLHSGKFFQKPYLEEVNKHLL